MQKLGQLTTAICCCNAFSVLVTPLFSIFAQKRMQELLLGADSTGYHACTDHGWINGETFLQWLQLFAEQGRQAATI
jgi:hypothetical protein